MKENTCCFIGHRIIEDTPALRAELYVTIEGLITGQRVDTFLFGSRSAFDALCLKVVTKLKEKYPHIKRIYVRAECPKLDDERKAVLSERYEASYFPHQVLGAGKAVYVKRNIEMIDKSRFCVMYFDEEYVQTAQKSGTKIVFDHAVRQGKEIIQFPVRSNLRHL